MDRNTVIGYVLILAIFLGYFFMTNSNYEDAKQQEQQRDSLELVQRIKDSLAKENIAISSSSSPSSETVLTAPDSTESNSDSVEIVQELVEPEKFAQFSNGKLNIGVSTYGGKIARVELPKYKRHDSSALVLLDPATTEFGFLIPFKNRVVDTKELVFDIAEQSDSVIVMEHRFPEGGKLRYKYTLSETYKVDFGIQMVGLANVIPSQYQGFDMNWNAALHQQEKDLESERDASGIYYKYKSETGIENLSEVGSEKEELTTNLHWVSFKQKFFNSTLIFPDGLHEGGTKIEQVQPEEEEGDTALEYMNADLWLPYNVRAEEEEHLTFYFGPNHYQTLKKEEISLEDIIPMGTWIIGVVNKWLIVPIFNFLNQFISSYGLIILLLTIIIKMMLLFPMYKIYVSSAKMKLLKPELDELKAKVGNDMQKLQQEQMKLYKKAGVSPFGGCLPQLIQLPILLAMFRFFPSSIELRQQGFLWATDLSTYDVIWSWDAYIPFISTFYGNHISLFTLLMAGSSILYTTMNSAQMSGANGSMKFIMYLMPIFLLFWFNSYSAGLSYYYFLANMITFGQNWVFRNFIVDDAKLHRQIQEHKKKKGTVKKSNWQKRLEKMAQQRGVDPKTGRRK